MASAKKATHSPKLKGKRLGLLDRSIFLVPNQLRHWDFIGPMKQNPEEWRNDVQMG